MSPLWFKWSFSLAPHMWCVGKKEEKCSMGSLQVAKYNFLKEWESWKNWKFWVTIRKSGTGCEKLGANCDNVWRGANWMWHCAKVAKEWLLGQVVGSLCIYVGAKVARGWVGGWPPSECQLWRLRPDSWNRLRAPWFTTWLQSQPGVDDEGSDDQTYNLSHHIIITKTVVIPIFALTSPIFGHSC